MANRATACALFLSTNLIFVAGMAVADVAVPNAPSSVACAASACRSGTYRVNLTASDGARARSVEFDSTPYVQDGRITIYPGEALVFRFSPTGESPGAPAFVRALAAPEVKRLPSDDPRVNKQIDPQTGEGYYTLDASMLENGTAADHLKNEPSNTLILFYHQVEGRPDMILRLEHNLSGPIKLNATMNRLRPDGGMEPTTTCPVHPVTASLETWPYPIGAIKLEAFRFPTVAEQLTCD